MANYNRHNVIKFVNKLRGCPGYDIARVWVACAFKLEQPIRYDLGRLIDEFFGLPLWEQQGVLYELATLVHEAALKAAHSRSQNARKEDPL